MDKTIEGQMNRLRVFRAVKAHMEETGECPIGTEIARQLRMEQSVVDRHMRALIHADGLPMPIFEGWRRKAEAQHRRGLKELEYTLPVDGYLARCS